MFEREDEEDSTRAMLMAGFEAFDDGKLTAENASEFELPKREPSESKEADGGASGADQAERGRQQTGKPDSSAADGDKTSERQRDEAGRFAKGEDKPAVKAADEAKPKDQQKPQQQQETQPPAAAAAPEPAPAGLSQQAAAVWANATPEVRGYITETENTLAKLYEPMKDVFTAAREIGVPWNQFVGNLVKAERHLRTNPQDALIWLAERSKIDLDELADYALAKRGGAGGTPSQQQIHPDLNRVVQPLAEQVAQLTSRLTQREQAEQQQLQDAATARNNAIKAEIQKFAGDATQAPHWKEVETHVWALIPAIRAQQPGAGTTEILKAAYDQAAWANPTVRAKLLAEQNQRQTQAQRAQRSRGLEGLTGHRGTPPPVSPAANGTGMTLRDEIAANWAAIDAR